MKLMLSTVFKEIFLIPKFSVRICCTVYLYSFLSVTHAIFNLSKVFTLFTFASVFCAAHFLDQCVNLLDSPWSACATQKALDFFQSFFLTSETWGCIRNKKFDIIGNTYTQASHISVCYIATTADNIVGTLNNIVFPLFCWIITRFNRLWAQDSYIIW